MADSARVGPPRGFMVSAVIAVLGWAYTALMVVLIVIVQVVTLGQVSMTVVRRMVRLWGRGTLAMAGIRLEVEGEEHLQLEGPAVVTFNHESSLDTLITAAVLPPRGTGVAKHQARYMPFLGQGMMLLGFVFLNRGESQRAIAAMNAAVGRITSQRLIIFIAPEGTRSPDGVLQPFKKGPFWLARDCSAPIVPMVIEGGHQLMPKGSFRPRRGVIRVRVLAATKLEALSPGSVTDQASALRGRYEATLADMRAS